MSEEEKQPADTNLTTQKIEEGLIVAIKEKDSAMVAALAEVLKLYFG